MSSRRTFIFGAQYYRAPSPEPACWAEDLRRMKELGLCDVQFAAQWRWCHRGEDRFYFEDIDHLMDLATANGLHATVSLLLDVAPIWLYRKYPDARQVMAGGATIQQYASAGRPIGGAPGPCYNHPGALGYRQAFVAAVIEHFKGHPALAMWELWSPDEQLAAARPMNPGQLVCYCYHCREQFITWLKSRYASRDDLNGVWGRCYEEWHDIEVPRGGEAVADFLDWRQFHLDSINREAAWRIQLARTRDPAHEHYLQIAPNTLEGANSIGGGDAVELAALSPLVAAAMDGPAATALSQAMSVAGDKPCIAVDRSLTQGSVASHQPQVDQRRLLERLLPAIGAGVKGLMLGQYRPEVLGAQAPAGGLVALDGTDRPITTALRHFHEVLAPHLSRLMGCQGPVPTVGIWKSRSNELFHYAIHGKLHCLAEGVNAYIQACYWNSYPLRIVDQQTLEAGRLEGLKLLIMPCCYCLSDKQARQLERWVSGGGVLLCEAHLGAYDASTGRHSRQVPGCGLAEAWGIREADSAAVGQLANLAGELALSARGPMKVALEQFAAGGGMIYPIALADGSLTWGADRYAVLGGTDIRVEGRFEPDGPCLVSKEVDRGAVYYCGTNLGRGVGKDPQGLSRVLSKAVARAGVAPVASNTAGLVHADVLGDAGGPCYVMIQNRGAVAVSVRLDVPVGQWQGLFTGITARMGGGEVLTVEPGFIDLMVRL